MSKNSIESRFDDILALVIANSRGEVSNDAVENALAAVVPAPAVANQKDDGAAATSNNAFNPNKNGIVLDTDNYDFDDDESEGQSKPAARARQININAQEPSQKRGVGRPKSTNKIYEDSLENIPLGKMGSRMLTTFGDGPQPSPAVVSAALLGARSSLQRAVLDARALYRRLKDQWHHARASALEGVKTCDAKKSLKKTVGAVASSDLVVDNKLSFRALNASWEREIPCGFNVKSLEVLFPEEMHAYQRWKKLHEAYSQSSNDDVKSAKFTDADEETMNEADDDFNSNFESSRLYERMGNFDARTNNMNSNSYIQFADVRKGSFLPRKELDSKSKEWAKSRSVRMKGRPSGKKQTTWTNLHPSTVVFLHWLGFDPMSSLPPPDEDTAQALGFLAHDFLGKIVEKAVVIHLQKSKAKSAVQKGMLPELSGGDQLEIPDIERAISETSLRSLYSSTDDNIGKSSQIAQLYFGPGFEDRLELELEEIFGAKDKRLTAEEMKIRQEEEALFSGLTVPPPMLSSLTNDEETEGNDEEGTPANKKQRTGGS